MKKVLLAFLFLLASCAFILAEELPVQTDGESAISTQVAEKRSEGDLIRETALRKRDNFLFYCDLEDVSTLPLGAVAAQLRKIPQLAQAEFDLIDRLQQAVAEAGGADAEGEIANPFRSLQISGFLQNKRKSTFLCVAETREIIPFTRLASILNQAVKEHPEFKITAKIQNTIPVMQIASEKFQNPLSFAALKNQNFLVLGTAKEVGRLIDDLAAGLEPSGSNSLLDFQNTSASRKYPVTIVSTFDASSHLLFDNICAKYGMKDSEIDFLMDKSSGLVLKLDHSQKDSLDIYLALVFPKAEQAAMAKSLIFDGLIMNMMRFALMQFTGDQPIPLFDTMQTEAKDEAAILTFTFTLADAEILKPIISSLAVLNPVSSENLWTE